MAENKFKKYISVLDTERFGFGIAKTDFSNIEPKDAINGLKELGVRLIMSRVSGKNIALINKLEELGFLVKDNQLTYRYELDGSLPSISEEDFKYNTREVLEKDIPQLVKFTEESFSGYGHYFADERLDRKKCQEIYEDWVYRSCTDKKVADKVFVAESKGEAIGYLSFKIFRKGEHKYAAGGLGSVSREFRNKSIFRAITVHGLKWGKEMKLDWEEHNVLSTNFPVNRSFSKLGFGIVASYVTLHGWID
jgi:hypothetical protein